jgi:Pyruvate/2-oxoacid:ferredoxin oxidoreductase delta subunit
MGHHRQLESRYRALVDRLDAGQVGMPEPEDERAWQGFKEILEICYTPAEAELAARMPLVPTTLRKLAERVGRAESELQPELERMCDKGLVMDLVHPKSGELRYFLSPPVVGFFEFSLMRAHDMFPKKRVAEAMDAYMHGDRTFAEEVFGGDTVIGRALAQEEKIAADERPDVLDFELASAVVRDARSIAVSLCYCRHKAEHLGHPCDAPQEICLSLNRGADFVLRHGFGRSVEPGEALEMLHQAKEKGLVQIADNVQKRPAYVCNCCGCCCAQLRAINDYGLPAVNPSGFVPRTDDDRCKGCSRCSRACPVTAIGMVARRATAKPKNELRPAVDQERCIGCGVCAGACRTGAMEMVRRDTQPFVPESALERITRMSLERGRLAHLLFDASESQGHRLMNRLVGTLAKLEPVERALASEQVRSRFVRWVTSKARSSGPTPSGG